MAICVGTESSVNNEGNQNQRKGAEIKNVLPQEGIHSIGELSEYLLKQEKIPSNSKEFKEMILDKKKAFEAEVNKTLFVPPKSTSSKGLNASDIEKYKRREDILLSCQLVQLPISMLALSAIVLLIGSWFILIPVAGLIVSAVFIVRTIIALRKLYSGGPDPKDELKLCKEIVETNKDVKIERKAYFRKLDNIFELGNEKLFKEVNDQAKIFKIEAKIIGIKRQFEEVGLSENLMDSKEITLPLVTFVKRMLESYPVEVDSAIDSIIKLWKDEKNQSDDNSESVLLEKIGSLLELFSCGTFFVQIVAENDTNAILEMKGSLLDIHKGRFGDKKYEVDVLNLRTGFKSVHENSGFDLDRKMTEYKTMLAGVKTRLGINKEQLQDPQLNVTSTLKELAFPVVPVFTLYPMFGVNLLPYSTE